MRKTRNTMTTESMTTDPTTTDNTTTPNATTGGTTVAMLIGLGLTVIATLVALLDPQQTDLVGQHVREAYPQWDAGTVATERTAIVGWLVGVGVLGIVGWLTSLWAVRRRSRRALWLAAVWFALAVVAAGLTLGTGGEAYDVIVPTPLGLLSALPLVAGVVVLMRMWRDRAALAPA